MLNIYRNGNSVVVEGLKNKYYPFNDVLTYPTNSIILTLDESDMATFKSASTNDVYFSALIDNITINDEAVDKDTILTLFSSISNVVSSGGGGEGGAVSSVNGQTGDVMITASSLNVYTKSQVDAKIPDVSNFTTKEESAAIEAKIPSLEGYATEAWVEGKNYLTEHQDISGLATKTELENVENKIPDVSDFVKSETLDGYYTKQQTDGELSKKQDTLVSGTNIKTVNGVSLLGEGNITVEGGSGSVDISNYYTIEEIDDITSGLASKTELESDYQKKLYNNQGTYNESGIIATIDGEHSLFQDNVNVASYKTIDPLLIDINGASYYGSKFNLNTNTEKVNTNEKVAYYCLFDTEVLEQYILDNINFYINYIHLISEGGSGLLVYRAIASVMYTYSGSSMIYMLQYDEENYGSSVNIYEDTDENGNVLFGSYSMNGEYVHKYKTKLKRNGTWRLNIDYDGSQYNVNLTINYNKVDYLNTDFAIKPSNAPSTGLMSYAYPENFTYNDTYYTRVDLIDNYKCLYYYNVVDYEKYLSIPSAPNFRIDGKHVPSKQDILVSGTNIKTINGNSLLGEGDLVITGGGGSIDMGNYYTKTEIDGMIGNIGTTLDAINGEEV